MKAFIFLSLLCFNVFSQTEGEIKSKNFDFKEFNTFLAGQSKTDRIVKRAASFKVDPILQTEFYAILNISNDTANVYDGEITYKLEPFSQLTGESVFNVMREIERPAPFLNVYSATGNKDLYIVYKLCTDCKLNLKTKKVHGSNITEKEIRRH